MNQPTRPDTLPPLAKPVWQGTIFTAWQWEQELFDGTKQTFEALTRPDSAFTVGILPHRQILLVEDEQPHRTKVLTMAGGRVETGEDPVTAARREFLEETGFSAGQLKPWFSISPENKIKSTIHFFVGQQLVKQAEPQNSPGEKIALKVVSFDKFLALGQSDYFRDLFIRIILLEAQLDPGKRDKLEQLLFT